MQMQNIAGQRWGQTVDRCFLWRNRMPKGCLGCLFVQVPSLKKLREIFQCDFSLENHKNESLIMRDSLRAQLWAWQSYRPEYIYIYLVYLSLCVCLTT